MTLRKLATIALLGLTSSSLLIWQQTTARQDDDEILELYGLFVDAVEQVETNYVTDIDRRALLENALRGMLRDLDPYSSYISRDQWQQFRKQIQGNFGGVGISVQVDPAIGRPRIIAPIVGTPAYEAGILASDIVLSIDGTSTEDLTQEELIDRMQGRPGTKVSLEVRHEQTNEVETLEVTRAIIEVPSVLGDARRDDDSWDWVVDDDEGLAYIRISSFVQTTDAELEEAINEAIAQGAQGIAIDLRDNPGGLLTAAVAVSDLFLDQGTIVSTKGRNTPERIFRAKKRETVTDLPLAILINNNSASASEIVSACLQDYDRAVIVGERSFGKGSVQNIIELEDGQSVLKLTVAAYQRPSGKNIDRYTTTEDTWGVTPNEDYLVELTPDQRRDLVLARRKRDRLLGNARGKDAEGQRNVDEPLEEFQDLARDRAFDALRQRINGKTVRADNSEKSQSGQA